MGRSAASVPVLLRLTSEAVYHTGDIPQGAAPLPEDFVLQPSSREQPLVIGSFREAVGKQYVMIVNRDIAAEVITRWIASGESVSVYEVSKQTGEEVPAEYDPISGTLTVTLMPGEGRCGVM